MAKSNIKLLTKDEQKFFNDNYSFEIKDDIILVRFKDYGRVIAHSINEPFNISSKVRKIRISVEAMKLWNDNFKGTSTSLVDVQNAMNALIISYQGTDINDVKAQLDIIKEKQNTF